MEEKKIESTKKYQTKDYLVVGLSVVLAALIIVFVFQQRSHNSLVGELNNEKDSIRVELESLIVSYDSLEVDNDSLSLDLDLAQMKVRSTLTELEQVKKASYKEITKYKDKVETLTKIMRTYWVQIDSLNQMNEALMAENQKVKEQYTQEALKAKQLEKEKSKLQATVKKAQLLEALELSATGLSPRNKSTLKVAKAQKLMVSFTLSKNLTAKRGDKNIYVRIQRPDQLLLVESDKNLFRYEDSKIPYSAVRKVNYEGNELPVNIYWDNTGKPMLKPGTYTVDIFADGSNVGTTTFVLRK